MEWSADWVSAVGTAAAAVFSAIAAWQSARSAKASSDEAKRAQEQADKDRHQVAAERAMLAAEAVNADVQRIERLAVQAKLANASAAIASGGYGSSRQKLVDAQCESKLDAARELAAPALLLAKATASEWAGMGREEIDAKRTDMARVRERLAVTIEDLAKLEAEGQHSLERLTTINDQRRSGWVAGQ